MSERYGVEGNISMEDLIASADKDAKEAAKSMREGDYFVRMIVKEEDGVLIVPEEVDPFVFEKVYRTALRLQHLCSASKEPLPGVEAVQVYEIMARHKPRKVSIEEIINEKGDEQKEIETD